METNGILAADLPVAARLGSQSSPTQRILVVEDDSDIRQLNTDALIRSGFQVDAAEDGAAAWENLQLESYDLMLTDNEMPKVSGIELLKKLRAARMVLPVIMASGTLPNEEFIRNPWLRPAATLIKPYTLDELLGTVREILRAAEVEYVDKPIAPLPIRQCRPTIDGFQLR